ncbi:pseudouridine synthase family protein isoform X2 [Carex rostrata]
MPAKSPILMAVVAKEAARMAGMESEKQLYAHYNHTDSCHLLRWTARESYQFMYERPWEKVVQFYSNLVSCGTGASGLSELFRDKKHGIVNISENGGNSEETEAAASVASKDNEKRRGGRWNRLNFKIILSYHGGSFDGWQKQPDLNTVQGVVEKSLGEFVDENKAKQLKERSLPIEGSAQVAGRTDKGVTALQQVCSFYTWRKDVRAGEIKDAINHVAPEKLVVLAVSKVSREFHPNFVAKWRHYLYIFPLKKENPKDDSEHMDPHNSISKPDFDLEEGAMIDISQKMPSDKINEGNVIQNPEAKPQRFSVNKVDQILRQLEGKMLSYKMFARDTQASRSMGPAMECFMFHSRATETTLPSTDKSEEGIRVMCVELVANRFLRKMVRVLVATAIREAAAGVEQDALINLMGATCRRATAPPAPPDGLCLVDVGYDEFKRENCFILD